MSEQSESPLTPVQLFDSEGSQLTPSPMAEEEMPPLIEESADSQEDNDEGEDEEEDVDESEDEADGKEDGEIDLDAKLEKDTAALPEVDETDESFDPEAGPEDDLDTESGECEDHEQCIADAEGLDEHLCKSLLGLGDRKERVIALADCICEWYTNKPQ